MSGVVDTVHALDDFKVFCTTQRLGAAVARIGRRRVDQHANAIFLVDQVAPAIRRGIYPATIFWRADERRIAVTGRDGLCKDGADLFDRYCGFAYVGLDIDFAVELGTHLLQEQLNIRRVLIDECSSDLE